MGRRVNYKLKDDLDNYIWRHIEFKVYDHVLDLIRGERRQWSGYTGRQVHDKAKEVLNE